MRSANSPSRSAFPPFIGSVLSLLVATLGLQCSCGGRGSSGSGGANPPAPPPPELPAEIKQQMPHSRDGLPLLGIVPGPSGGLLRNEFRPSRRLHR